VTPSPRPATETPSADLEATAFFATNTAVAAALVAAVTPEVHASYRSLDGQWLAEIITYECTPVLDDFGNAFEQLRLTRADPPAEFVVDSQLRSCGGLGAAGLDVVAWSPNGRYLYYTDGREGVPDGGCGPNWVRPVLRADLNTRATEPVGPAQLSPDQTHLAFKQGDVIVVWSLDEGQVGQARAAAPGVPVEDIAWSPGSKSIAYLQVGNACMPTDTSYVGRLDLPGLEPTLLFDSQSPLIISMEWDSPDALSLAGFERGQWVYDFADGELRPVP
jgi:hypothetical protein